MSLNHILRYVSLVCLPFTVFLPQTSLAATTYDAVANFSNSANPNGAWSYGWSTTLGGQFIPYAPPTRNPYPGIDSWEGPECPGDFLFPVMSFNHTGATYDYASGVSQPPNVLNLHPSCNGSLSVLRWTAPSSGWFNVAGLFQGIDVRNTSSDAHILHNSTASVFAANINGFGTQVPFSFTRYFAAGDTLDFAIGWGINGNFNADSTGVAVTITNAYSVCLLYNPEKAVKSGATIPIKLQLCDGSGNNLSSSSLTLHAVSAVQTSTQVSGDVQTSGNANPDNDFRFDSSLGQSGGYIFNLSTKGLTTGSYNLTFTVNGDSSVRQVPFQVY